MTANADEWRFFPGLSSDYVAEPNLSAMVGMSGIDGSSYASFGVELSFNCPLLRPPTNRIREQLSYSFTPINNDAVVHSVELNPHYLVDMGNGLSAGGGPGLAVTAVSGTGGDTAVGAGLGASVHYDIDQFLAGGEFRYLYHFSDNIDGNWRVMAKIGYRFR